MKPKLILCLALVLSGNFFVCHADETNSIFHESDVTMSLSSNGTTNSSTVTIEATNSTKGFANAIATNYEKLILSSTNLVPSNFVPALPMVTESIRTNFVSALTNSSMVELGEAIKFLTALKKQGRLPGTPPDSHGDVTTGNLPLSQYQEAKYPFIVTFHASLTGDAFTNHYTVVRPMNGAAWQLEKAWRTDTDGKTIKEWPVKP